MDWSSFIPQALGAAAGALAAYMAIREDIATLKAQVTALKEDNAQAHARADHAHARIDSILGRGK